MMIKCIQKIVKSSDKKHYLNGVVYVPDGEIRGLFQIVHGMTEYIGRYDSFMRKLAKEGFVVFGHDHLGHGYTVDDDSEYGFIAHQGGWKYLVDDVAIFGNRVRSRFDGSLPFILMGHSMGSFIARLAAEKFDSQDKLILLGTGGPNPLIDMGRIVLEQVQKVKGDYYISDLIQKMFFGAYNQKFEKGDPYAWLSTIEENRRVYAGDRLCNFRFTVSAMGDLARLVKECNTERWFSSCVTEKPILLLSGQYDPVGDYGRGVKRVRDELVRHGAHVKMVLYRNCRHEILFDICRERAISEIKLFSFGA